MHRLTVLALSGLVASAPAGTWTQRGPATSPPARYQAATAYDPVHRVLVLFGGFTSPDGFAPSGDTWTWNGTTWTDVTPAASPPVRGAAAMAWDGHELVLFGGAGGTRTLLNDTWTWDGRSWTQRHPAAPPAPRIAAAMAWDGHEAVLFGGSTGTAPLRDTWTWNGTDWTKRTPTHAPPRKSAVAAYDPPSDSALLVSGATAWRYRAGDWTPLVPACAGAACPAEAELVAYDGHRTILYTGGKDPQTWLLADGRWTRAAGASPPGRRFVAGGYDEARRDVVLFGGLDAANRPVADTWAWTGRADARTSVPPATPPTSPAPSSAPSTPAPIAPPAPTSGVQVTKTSRVGPVAVGLAAALLAALAGVLVLALRSRRHPG